MARAATPRIPGNGARLLRLVVLSLLAVGALVPARALAAPKPQLSSAIVKPRSALAGQLVTFSVTCRNPQPTAIDVLLTRPATPTRAIGLSQIAPGTWSAQSATIPVGTWSVTFSIPSTGETLQAGTLTITPAPTPTPKPTATPTPRVTPAPTKTAAPTSRPTSTATSAATSTGSASPAASGASASGSPNVAASGSGTPASPNVIGGFIESASPGAAPAGSTRDQTGPLLLSILVGLFVIGGVAGIAVLTARRREDEPAEAPAAVPAFVAAHPTGPAARRFAEDHATAPDSTGTPPGRRRAAWEVYSALEDEPIGTVDQLMPGSSPPAAAPAEELNEED